MKDIRVVDANVVLRYLLADHPEHHREAAAFFKDVKGGEAGAHVPEGVLVECVYVLLKVYEVPRDEISAKLSGLLAYRGIENDDLPILRQALALFAEHNVDIVDALVHTTAEAHGWQTFSFDADIARLNEKGGKGKGERGPGPK